jgi:hypothetical protein
MSGAIPPLPHYAFMVWCLVKSTGTTLPLPFTFIIIIIIIIDVGDAPCLLKIFFKLRAHQ